MSRFGKGSWGVPLVRARAVAFNGDPASLARDNIMTTFGNETLILLVTAHFIILVSFFRDATTSSKLVPI